ncbi:Magnesium transporter MRS2-I [Ancistrocladus abbreviatus]
MGKKGYIVPAGEAELLAAVSSVKKKTPGGSQRQSWILFDSSGQSTTLDVDKYAIIRRVHINARDLRILDPILSYPPAILGRGKAIVLNLEHIKVIITADEVLLRDPLDDIVVPVVEELHRRLSPTNTFHQSQGHGCVTSLVDVYVGDEDESPFEFRALEVALEAICSFLDARTTELETAVYPALDALISKISIQNMDTVRKLKSAMTRLIARVQKVRDELEQLLDDDHDMADLYLSRKLSPSSPINGSGAPNWSSYSPTVGSRVLRARRTSAASGHEGEHDVEELEMLLEAYFMEIDGTLNRLTTLREYIDDTEDYINIQLDSKRNQLIQLDLFLSTGTLCLSIYSLVTGIFGVNLPYSWNTGHNYLFKWVVMTTTFCCAALYLSIIAYAHRKGLIGS